MSNGIFSGSPPAAGGAGGVAGAGAGVGDCAKASEPIAARAQAATVIEIIERIEISQFKFVSAVTIDAASHRRRQAILAVGDARGLHRAVSLLLAGSDEYLGARL